MGQKDQVLAYMAKRIRKLDGRCRVLVDQLNAQGDRARAAERLCGEQEATINGLRADNAGLGQALIAAQRDNKHLHAENKHLHAERVVLRSMDASERWLHVHGAEAEQPPVDDLVGYQAGLHADTPEPPD